MLTPILAELLSTSNVREKFLCGIDRVTIFLVHLISLILCLSCECKKMNKLILPEDIELRNSNYLSLAILFFLGLVVVCLDIINIDLGNFKLKIAYIWFLLYLILFSLSLNLSIKKDNFHIALIFLFSLLPSVLFSKNIVTSLAFYAGAIVCVVIMLLFAKMTVLAAPKVISILFGFYRFSVILTLILVILGIQERGHFLLYESSYYAIVLIPYFCMTFYRLFLYGFKTSVPDIALIIIAIATSQSVSMVGWCVLSFFCIYIRSGLSRKIHFLLIGVGILLFFTLAYIFNERANAIISRIFLLFENPSDSLSLLVFVVGNRLQRIVVGYEAFIQNPLVGVGLGAFREYSANNFDPLDFALNGVSASDFTVDTPAANVFIEMAAEGGIIGLVGYIWMLIFIHRKKNNSKLLAPFKIAFYITMVSLLIEASYLRNYFWALYGIIIGLNSLNSETGSRLSFDPTPRK